MSEPTYRVDLTHQPANGAACAWKADVVRLRDETCLTTKFHDSRESAFAEALRWVVAHSQEPQHPSSVYLSEDGDLLDPAEVQR